MCNELGPPGLQVHLKRTGPGIFPFAWIKSPKLARWPSALTHNNAHSGRVLDGQFAFSRLQSVERRRGKSSMSRTALRGSTSIPGVVIWLWV